MTRPSAALAPSVRIAAALGALAIAGCLGTVVGTGIDMAGSAVTYPFREWVFSGAYEYDNTSDLPWRALEDDRGRDFGNELVGLAVSGGGSRSAYFLACVLDHLRDIPVPAPADAPPGTPTASLLDEVDFLSSVSGGSMAAAYYALKRPDTSDGALLDGFFDRFRGDMRKNFELRSVGRTLLLGRAFPLMFTHYHRGHVIAGVWDSNFFDDATFADLPDPRPPHPTLIINATSYSRGSKFLFTRLPTSRFNDSRLVHGLRELRIVTGGYTDLHRPFENVGFDTLASDIGTLPISYAVAASSGIPGVLGPSVLKDRSREDGGAFEVLGDGGLYDNYGLETLVQLFATILEERPGLRARIIVVDGSGFFEARTGHDEYTVADYADRVTSISWLRTGDYSDLIYGSLNAMNLKRLEAHAAGAAVPLTARTSDSPFRNLSLEVVSIYPPADTSVGAGGGKDPAAPAPRRSLYQRLVPGPIRNPLGLVSDVNERVRGLGTRFTLSDEDATAIEIEAGRAVRDTLGGPPAQ